MSQPLGEPRRIPIHRSLNRPSMILGGERELVLMTLLCCALVAFTASSVLQVIIAIVLWVTIHACLIAIAKSDPMMSQVYIRHIKYRSYYPAKTGECSVIPEIHEWND